MSQVAADAVRPASIPERLMRLVGRRKDVASRPAPSSELIQQMRALKAERQRVLELVQQEEQLQEDLARQAREADEARVTALTALRLGDGEPAADLATHEERAAVLHRRAKDAAAVAERLRAKLAEIGQELTRLSGQFAREQTRYLEQLYEAAMRRYNELAPAVAEAVLDVAAIRRVMMDSRSGNTNGWGGEILLPSMQPGIGRQLSPILDGASSRFHIEADARKVQVHEALRQAGFTY